MQKQARTGAIFTVFGLLHYLRAHFLDVEGYGEEGKVHCDLVFAEVPEAAVCHIELHLSEDGFRFDASSAPVLESFFRCKKFPCLSFVFIESVIDFDCSSVASGLVAQAPQRAALTVLRPVACAFTPVAACGL